MKDNNIQVNTEKMADKAPESSQPTLSNWVRGDNAYVNLDKLIEVTIKQVGEDFIVIGLYVNRGGSFDEVGIKKYNDKDDALAWIASIMGVKE